MADNRQYTDHNEIGGVNVYLEDKKLAESPTKDTVATTDYVLLKDDEDIPRKISKANLMGVVKDALADLLRNNDLGTSVTSVPALSASDFGCNSLENLATLLGTTVISQNNLDVDTATTAGTYQGNSWTNTPPGLDVNGSTLHVFVAYPNNVLVHQKFLDPNGRIAARTMFNGVWSSWTRMDAFGCSTPSELASALGEAKSDGTPKYPALFSGLTQPLSGSYLSSPPNGVRLIIVDRTEAVVSFTGGYQENNFQLKHTCNSGTHKLYWRGMNSDGSFSSWVEL